MSCWCAVETRLCGCCEQSESLFVKIIFLVNSRSLSVFTCTLLENVIDAGFSSEKRVFIFNILESQSLFDPSKKTMLAKKCVYYLYTVHAYTMDTRAFPGFHCMKRLVFKSDQFDIRHCNVGLFYVYLPSNSKSTLGYGKRKHGGENITRTFWWQLPFDMSCRSCAGFRESTGKIKMTVNIFPSFFIMPPPCQPLK